MRAALWFLSLLFCSLVFGAPCSKYKPDNTPISLLTISRGNCKTSLDSDFAARDQWALENPYSNCTIGDTWGPWPKLYQQATIPKSCDPVSWQQQRVVKAIDWLIKKGWNYCHHHSPYWLPPKTDPKVSGLRVGIPVDSVADPNSKGVCSSAAWPNNTANPHKDAHWTGVDCTHFTSYVYNFAFGAFLGTNTGNQACSTLVPGKLLKLTADQQAQFQPGDLLYIGSKSTDNPMRISHGVLWTGIKMDDPAYPQFSKKNLLAKVPPKQQNAVLKYWTQFPNQPTYVIADSHFNGPNYRPFAGWYYNAFSHARRLIQAPAKNTLPPGRKLVYTEGSGTCSIQKTK